MILAIGMKKVWKREYFKRRAERCFPSVAKKTYMTAKLWARLRRHFIVL